MITLKVPKHKTNMVLFSWKQPHCRQVNWWIFFFCFVLNNSLAFSANVSPILLVFFFSFDWTAEAAVGRLGDSSNRLRNRQRHKVKPRCDVLFVLVKSTYRVDFSSFKWHFQIVSEDYREMLLPDSFTKLYGRCGPQ